MTEKYLSIVTELFSSVMDTGENYFGYKQILDKIKMLFHEL